MKESRRFYPNRELAAHLLGYVGLDEDKYWEVVDSARSPHLWGKDGNAWVLKHQTR